jgi:hypothetical protein
VPVAGPWGVDAADLAVAYPETDDLGGVQAIGTATSPRPLLSGHVRDVHVISPEDGFRSPGRSCLDVADASTRVLQPVSRA